MTTALLTTHGTLLISRGGGRLGQADFGARADRSLVARWSGPPPVDRFQALVERIAPASMAAHAEWDGAAITVEPDPDDPALVRIERDGLRLTAEPGGAVGWTDRTPGEWERFLPLDDATVAALDTFLDNDWVICSSRTLVEAADITVGAGFTLRFGVLEVPIAAQGFEAADGAPFSFRLLRDGWRIEEVRLFRPLVFYAAFRSPKVHAQLFTSLQSLFEIGGYEGRVHVFTELGYSEIRRAVPSVAAAAALTTTPASPQDFVGYVAAKYGIVDCEAAADCQPLLYLDPDIVVNASLLPLLIDVAVSDRLVAPIEAHRFRKVSLGRDLIDADGARPDQGFGFNGGTIGIPNLRSGGPTLRLIRRIIVNYLAAHGRGSLPWVDQEAANYVAAKLDVFDEASISRYVRAGTADEAERPGPSSGLVHFWATPKDERHVVMRRYLARLRSRLRRFAPLAAIGEG